MKKFKFLFLALLGLSLLNSCMRPEPNYEGILMTEFESEIRFKFTEEAIDRTEERRERKEKQRREKQREKQIIEIVKYK